MTNIASNSKFPRWPGWIAMAFSMLCISLPALAKDHVESLEQITSGVRNPAMKKRWEFNYKKGTLPPLKALPIPSRPISKRKVFAMAESQKVIAKRPVIPENSPIAVQVFTKDMKMTRYQGEYKVISHQEGALKGQIANSKEAFEIIYKLPRTKTLDDSFSNSSMILDYETDVSDSALQRRIVLYDQEQKFPKIVSLAEGSEKPYQTTLEEIRLTIVQDVQSEFVENPPVTVNYKGQSVTLMKGDQKSLGKGKDEIQVYLLSSYAHDPRRRELLEGQPYYVNIIIYQ